jgi:hypothetical protein
MPKENCALADDAVIAPALQTWVRNCSLDIADSRNAISAAQAFASVGAWDALKQDARMFPSEAEISKIDKTSHKK